MTVRELIDKLETVEMVYGGNFDVYAFDLDRHLETVSDVEMCKDAEDRMFVYIEV